MGGDGTDLDGVVVGVVEAGECGGRGSGRDCDGGGRGCCFEFVVVEADPVCWPVWGVVGVPGRFELSAGAFPGEGGRAAAWTKRNWWRFMAGQRKRNKPVIMRV